MHTRSAALALRRLISKDEKPCLNSIWWTDEYDAIKNRVSKVTEVSQANLVGEADGVWQWLIGSIGKIAFDGARVIAWQTSPDSAERPGLGKSG